MKQKTEKLLTEILFIFGIILFLFSFGMLIYQIYHTFKIDWSYYQAQKTLSDAILYVVIEYVTSLFKIIISIYAIYAKKSIDDSINPLFTFTLVYVASVVLEFIRYISSGAFSLGLIVTANAFVDLVVSIFFLVITLIFKIDDWRPYRRVKND